MPVSRAKSRTPIGGEMQQRGAFEPQHYGPLVGGPCPAQEAQWFWSRNEAFLTSVISFDTATHVCCIQISKEKHKIKFKG